MILKVTFYPLKYLHKHPAMILLYMFDLITLSPGVDSPCIRTVQRFKYSVPEMPGGVFALNCNTTGTLTQYKCSVNG